MAMNSDSSPEVEVNEDGHIGNHDAAQLFDHSVTIGRYSSQPRPVLPPKPLAIYRTERNLAIELGSDWGTLDPFTNRPNYIKLHSDLMRQLLFTTSCMGLEYLGWCCVFDVVVEFQPKPMCKLL